MNNKLIQELLDDKETRDALWAALMEADDTGINIHDLMLARAQQANDEPVKGEMITIEVSHHMWVRGEYVCTEPDGRLLVSIPGKNPGSCGQRRIYAGKRVDMVIKGEEGRGKPDLVGTGVQKGIVAERRAKRGASDDYV